MKRLRLFISAGIILWVLMICPTNAFAGDILAKEYFVKTAFLYNFARLVEWPAKSIDSINDPIYICLIGEDKFGSALNTISNKKIKNQKIIVQRGVMPDKLSECNILFIDSSEKDHLQAIIHQLKKYPVLTVSDMPDFAQQNGHIRFFINTQKTLSLEVNHKAIIQSKLKISSKILTLAKIVSSDEAVEP